MPAQQSIEHLSYDGGPSPHVPSLKTPAVTIVDLSGIPEGTLGEWLCKHTMMIYICIAVLSRMISLNYRC